jgi:hypothetical protein
MMPKSKQFSITCHRCSHRPRGPRQKCTHRDTSFTNTCPTCCCAYIITLQHKTLVHLPTLLPAAFAASTAASSASASATLRR